jgi:hypothetical protein
MCVDRNTPQRRGIFGGHAQSVGRSLAEYPKSCAGAVASAVPDPQLSDKAREKLASSSRHTSDTLELPWGASDD